MTMVRTRAPQETPRDGPPPIFRTVALGYIRVGQTLRLDLHVGPWVLTPFCCVLWLSIRLYHPVSPLRILPRPFLTMGLALTTLDP